MLKKAELGPQGSNAGADKEETRKGRLAGLRQELESLRTEAAAIAPAVGRLMSDAEKREAHARLAALDALEFLEPPKIGSLAIRRALDAAAAAAKAALEAERLRASVAQLETSLEPEFKDKTSTEIAKQVAALSAEQRRQIEAATLREQLAKQELKAAELEAAMPDDPTEEVQSLEARRDYLREQRQRSLAFQAQVERQEELEIEQRRLEAQAKELVELGDFKKHCSELFTATLAATVASLNTSVDRAVETLFDQGLRVELRLARELKTKQALKHEVSFLVSQQGNALDGLSQLSGGEGDRVSLALSLSLNRLSACPFLLLDEALSSLDTEAKSQALQAVRELNPGKTVLCVAHDVVEGIYDSAIDLGAELQGAVKGVRF
jgi:DNA repair exonuclease SbcCD ATPase subunit